MFHDKFKKYLEKTREITGLFNENLSKDKFKKCFEKLVKPKGYLTKTYHMTNLKTFSEKLVKSLWELSVCIERLSHEFKKLRKKTCQITWKYLSISIKSVWQEFWKLKKTSNNMSRIFFVKTMQKRIFRLSWQVRSKAFKCGKI